MTKHKIQLIKLARLINDAQVVRVNFERTGEIEYLFVQGYVDIADIRKGHTNGEGWNFHNDEFDFDLNIDDIRQLNVSLVKRAALVYDGSETDLLIEPMHTRCNNPPDLHFP